jgi:nucleotide-binding universal stress UspA family protein
MKKIIAATDFSDAALNAIIYATDMAVYLEAELLLLHIYPMPVIHSDIPTTAIDNELMEESITMLRELKTTIENRVNGSISIKSEVTMGFFDEELESLCEKHHPYVIVVGTQGKTAAEKLWFGSHAVHAMQDLACPIIAVPPYASFSSLQKIGLAIDFSKIPEKVVLQDLQQFIKDFHAELHILNTSSRNDVPPEWKAGLDLLGKMLANLQPAYHFLDNNQSDSGILDFAKKNAIDLLIVLPGRRRFLDKMFHRSHTKHFVLNSAVPVMALHE